MKAVAGKILGMRRKLAARDCENVEDGHFMTPRNLLESFVEALDLSLILSTHRRRNARRTRNVRNVRHDDRSLSLLLQRTQNLFVVFCKLLDGETVADVVDTDSHCYEVR